MLNKAKACGVPFLTTSISAVALVIVSKGIVVRSQALVEGQWPARSLQCVVLNFSVERW